MIAIFPPPLDADGLVILQRAGAARQALIDAFNRLEKPNINAELYKSFKSYVSAASYGKCAYCEHMIASQPGDVEHFRPKNRVVDENFQPIRVQYPGREAGGHMGYFWLAYEYGNLLLSCADCNRYRVHEDGTGGGKADMFPVEGFRATLPGEEARENALLINPASDDPNVHLAFSENGLLRGRTPKGDATIKMFALNAREPLVQLRRTAYRASKRALADFIDEAKRGPSAALDQARDDVNAIFEGRTEFAAFGRLGLAEMQTQYAALGVGFQLPLVKPLLVHAPS